MAEKILFVLEGAAKEPGIFKVISQAVLQGNAEIVYTFDTHIYKLYSELKADSDLDLLGLLKEHKPGELDAYDGDSFSSIYLFFDYDGHVNMPVDSAGTRIDGDTAIMEMLGIFDEETDNGRLYISYPMAEALQHLKSIPANRDEIVTAKCKGPHCPRKGSCPDKMSCPPVRYYKTLVSQENRELQNISRVATKEWPAIFMRHIAVANIMVGFDGDVIDGVPSQPEIFRRQLADYISRDCPCVAVISAFPLFVADYLSPVARRSFFRAEEAGEVGAQISTTRSCFISPTGKAR